LTEALKLFKRRGYNGATYQAIADKIGIAKQSVIFHYKDKETLACSVIKELNNRVSHQVVVETMKEQLSGKQRKKRFFRNLRQFASENEFISVPIYLIHSESNTVKQDARSYLNGLLCVFDELLELQDNVKKGDRALTTFVGGMVLSDVFERQDYLLQAIDTLQEEFL
jgi:AcrR family transcriptional regulator